MQANECDCCGVKVNSKEVNQGSKIGTEMPCTLIFKGQSTFVDILIKEVGWYMQKKFLIRF